MVTKFICYYNSYKRTNEQTNNKHEQILKFVLRQVPKWAWDLSNLGPVRARKEEEQANQQKSRKKKNLVTWKLGFWNYHKHRTTPQPQQIGFLYLLLCFRVLLPLLKQWSHSLVYLYHLHQVRLLLLIATRTRTFSLLRVTSLAFVPLLLQR